MRVGVIGAGISGLSCARVLADAGIEVIVLEKSRSLAGRCATRSWRGHIVDHGAQFFTARHPEFRTFVESLGDRVRPLREPVVDHAGEEIEAGTGGRLYLPEGNNRMGTYLAEGIDIRRECAVDQVRATAYGWEAGGEKCDRLVLTTPLPQTLRLLVGKEPFPSLYHPCLAAFFSYRDRLGHPAWYARHFRRIGAALEWSACENHKENRVRPGELVFVVHSSAAFSNAYLEDDPGGWLAILKRNLEKVWGLSPDDYLDCFAHRWRYARPVNPNQPPLPKSQGLYLAGDSFSPSRVEDVWLSGLHTARAILAAA